eukprot:TRINITY_DN85486_c0_g1_i1.p1 TRINITY_DN85486_c0_g1~~TRINITY_DN85486_c0_g1_i1.p1  ORF type:complete len:266 (+),score=44.24 TRINITY_DN85486_c0_g1_i1:40-798(+)
MQLKLLTFNIWFAKHEMARRMQAICDIIGSKSPDLVALQEITAQHWALCREHPAMAGFTWSIPPPDQRYFTLLGSRWPFSHPPTRHEFEVTLMGRDLLYATVTPPGLPPLVFATSHLESLDRAKVRKEQIGESLQALQHASDAVFCGDTNIDERVDGEIALPAPWRDAWLEAKPDDPGYTFDVERNGMLLQLDDWARTNHARLRFDRFWIKSSSYAVSGIELLDETIDGRALWPSDHFGLLLVLDGRSCSPA